MTSKPRSESKTRLLVPKMPLAESCQSLQYQGVLGTVTSRFFVPMQLKKDEQHNEEGTLDDSGGATKQYTIINPFLHFNNENP